VRGHAASAHDARTDPHALSPRRAPECPLRGRPVASFIRLLTDFEFDV